MAYISSVKLPNNNVYYFKDSRLTFGSSTSQFLRNDGNWGNVAATATATLTALGWSNNTQSVTVSGVTSSNSIIVAPSPLYMDIYSNAGIRCTAQSTNSLTFECDSVPSDDIIMNILII